ncbi:hypothetical protein STEG23_020116, partial [Scotinomys teguina]
IVRETPISGVRTFYTDANKQGKAGYKSEDLSKVVQSPYNSVQKSELYAILLVLMDFSEPLNIVTDSQYAERVVLHIETAEFIPDESELTSLFIQLQDIIRNRKHPLYITHIRSHTGLPGPLAQVFSFVYDYETCQLLAAPIYFREDMGIEEPADGVNFHSGKRIKIENANGPISKLAVNSQPMSKLAVNSKPTGKLIVNTQPVSKLAVNPQPMGKLVVNPQPMNKIAVNPQPMSKLAVNPCFISRVNFGFVNYHCTGSSSI